MEKEEGRHLHCMLCRTENMAVACIAYACIYSLKKAAGERRGEERLNLYNMCCVYNICNLLYQWRKEGGKGGRRKERRRKLRERSACLDIYFLPFTSLFAGLPLFAWQAEAEALTDMGLV